MSRIFVLLVLLFLVVQTPLMGQSPGNLGPAPVIPDPPADIVPPPASSSEQPRIDIPERLAPLKTPVLPPNDPVLQDPLKIGTPGSDLARGSAEFAAKRYTQASAIFAEAHRRGEKLTDTQRDEWAYCRLHTVATRINKGNESPSTVAELGKEVEDALRSGSDRLMPFGKQLLDELGRRGVASTPGVAAGWEQIEGASFRVLFHGSREMANEIAQTAEAARRAMYERWAGPPASEWSPRCDIYLHATAADYAKATGKNAEIAGHSTVSIKGERVMSRRIDLRRDDAAVLDCTLAHQITLVLLAEMFAEQPLPRWALVGMAVLAESPESVASYRRAVPGLLQEKKLFAVGPFMEKAEYPTAENMTPFYAESVSLVSYMVELRGPKAFAAFLREAPRRGISKALASHYEIKSPADLQDRWVKHSLGGQ